MSDRVSEAYHGRRGSERDTRIVRNRIHWMCRNAEGPRILDVGCSQGIATILLARDGHEVTGLDLDPEALRYGRAQLETESDAVRRRVHFVQSPVGEAPLEEASFQTVLMGETIEHVVSPDTFLQQALRFLVPGGRAVLTTPLGLHPDPDHKQTFYPHAFLRLVGKYLEPESYHFEDAYIHFTGRLRDRPLSPAELDEMQGRYGMERLDDASDRALWAKESRYVETIDALRARRDRLAADFEVVRARVKAAEVKAAEAAQELQRFKRSSLPLGPLKGPYRRIKTQAAELTERSAEVLPPIWKERLTGRRRSESRPPRLLFVPTNGTGLGHLTRCLALASRVVRRQPEAEAIFYTTSVATREVERLGYSTYFIPPRNLRPNLEPGEWNRMLRAGLELVIELHQIDGVVFDGVSAYSGFLQGLRSTRTPAVWVSRGGWREPAAHVARLLQAEADFQRIVIPGEISEVGDPDLGPVPPALVPKLSPVGPVVFQGPESWVCRTEAMEALRLKPSASHVLLQLGAGNINDTDSVIRTVIRVLEARFPQARLCLAQSPLAEKAPQVPPHIHVLQSYPLGAYLKAFDLVVTAAGYNSVHESLMCGIPTLVIPNEATGTDDQVKRAERAAAAPRVEVVHPFSEALLRARLHGLFDGAELSAHREGWRPWIRENGADAASELLLSVLKPR